MGKNEREEKKMKYEEIFSVGYDLRYGGFDYAVKLNKITRKEYNEILITTYYALKQLEGCIADENGIGEMENND